MVREGRARTESRPIEFARGIFEGGLSAVCRVRVAGNLQLYKPYRYVASYVDGTVRQ